MENVSKYSRLNTPAATAAHRCPGAAKQAAKCPSPVHPDGFLTHSFSGVHDRRFHRHQQLEQQFFHSLDNLCDFYDWPVPQTKDLPFPASVAEAFTQISQKFSSLPAVDCMIVQRPGCRAALATIHSFPIEDTLLYIPLRPLYHLYTAAEHHPAAPLIASLFNYLHKVAGVAYMTSYSYITRTYRMIEDWLYDAYEDEDLADQRHREKQQEEILELLTHAERLEPLICRPFKLRDLKKAVARYAACEQMDAELLEIARALLSLAASYPRRSVYNHLHYQLIQEQDREVMYMESYLSFYWSSSVSFEDFFYDTINADLQEHDYKQEPTQLRCFDKPQQKPVSFDFESLFFPLIKRFIIFLEQKDQRYEEHHPVF